MLLSRILHNFLDGLSYNLSANVSNFYVEKPCWKFQCMLKTVLKISMCVENVLKLPKYDPFYQPWCIKALSKVKTDIINKYNRLIWHHTCSFVAHTVLKMFTLAMLKISRCFENVLKISRHVENMLKILRHVENVLKISSYFITVKYRKNHRYIYFLGIL